MSTKKRRLSGHAEIRDACFRKLASDQRGRPESAMMQIHEGTMSPMYGSVAEHVGDLTHRMSEFPGGGLSHGYPYVGEKVEKTLRWLTNPYGFEREVRENVASAVAYNDRQGHPLPCGNDEMCLRELKRRGRVYAAEHRKLKPCNRVQLIAKNAAIAIGEWRFKDAIANLTTLKKILDAGEDYWISVARRYDPVR
jgi:hypothetical protein